MNAILIAAAALAAPSLSLTRAPDDPKPEIKTRVVLIGYERFHERHNSGVFYPFATDHQYIFDKPIQSEYASAAAIWTNISPRRVWRQNLLPPVGDLNADPNTYHFQEDLFFETPLQHSSHFSLNGFEFDGEFFWLNESTRPGAPGVSTSSFTVSNIPEPSTWALMALGLGAGIIWRWRRLSHCRGD